MRAVVELMKPAHTHFVSIVEPVVPPLDDRWVVGEGEVGKALLF